MKTVHGRGWCAGLVSLALLAVLNPGCDWRQRVVTPPADAPVIVEGLLDGAYSPIPGDAVVAGIVYTFAEQVGEKDQFAVRQITEGRLPPEEFWPPDPEDARESAGLYLGVFDAAASTVLYLVPVTDPRVVVGEGPDADGHLAGSVVRRRGGSVAARFPFLPDTTVVLFGVDTGGDISEVPLFWEAGGSLSSRRQVHPVGTGQP